MNLKKFLKPTKMIAMVFLLFLMWVFCPIFIDQEFQRYGIETPQIIENTSMAFNMILIQLPFGLFKFLRLPVGPYSDYFGFANPNGFGWVLIVIFDVAIAYLLACTITKIRSLIGEKT